MNGNHQQWMAKALELAEQGRGFVEPNPLVGALVVHNGKVIGEGWHQKYGGPHAEVHALTRAGAAAKGADLYVTLEPCCHYGKTPPCTDLIINKGVRRVIIAMPDPFPAVSGNGIQKLQAAGIEVIQGINEPHARRLNAPYLKLITTEHPYVHLKWAMTLDGKIATKTGDSKWISNEKARERVHQLRGRVDGILVGIGTVLADDPLLTARPPGPRMATRIVLDSQGRIPLTTKLVQTANEIPTIIVVRQTDQQSELEANGCEVITLPGKNRPSIDSLLSALGQRKMTNLLVEGGAEVLGSFINEKAVDEAHIYIAPKLTGGKEAPGPTAGPGVEKINQALTMSSIQSEQIEDNIYLHATR